MGILKKKADAKKPLAAALKNVAKKTTQAVKTAAAKKPVLTKVLKAAASGGVSLVVNKKNIQKVGANPNLKKVLKVGAALSTGGASLLLDKKNREKVSAAAKKVASTAGTAAKKVANAGKKVATMALFLPFVPVALLYLKRRGIKPSKKPEELVTQVHNEISKKSFGLIQGGDSFDYGADTMDFGYADEMESYGIIPITPGMVMAVIGFLKTIFENIKKKRLSGEPLTADEQEILNMAPQIDKELGEAKSLAGDVLEQSENQARQIEGEGIRKAGAIVETASLSAVENSQLPEFSPSQSGTNSVTNTSGADIAAQAEATAVKDSEEIKKDADKDKTNILQASAGSPDNTKAVFVVVVIVVVIILFLGLRK